MTELTDGLTRAQFVLWRDNIDLHPEEFPDFGIGTNHMLKLVRLHSNIVQVSDLEKFKLTVTAEGESRGNYGMLGKMNVWKANRELYKLLHRRLTVGLKATSVLTCSPE